MEIGILGTGCPNCKRLEKVTRQALDEMGVEATVTKVTDMMDILSYQIPSTETSVSPNRNQDFFLLSCQLLHSRVFANSRRSFKANYWCFFKMRFA